ncbi:response regulator transcription factor [Telmatocola sphagniphila]|uniref:Response regulator transcription factor n=1 Tax=Telmatocola sphagniphila TaxID=1123043 RepID=A0A8E6B820_9BACT|nr:response regulator transcription factor [Telmatocola sphagniphila]QVL32979.1 response regulator transcription factor [Telmatocola sphagniphila]
MITVANRRIMLVDDHAILRAGIRAYLEKIPGVEVVGEFAEGEKAIEAIAELKPDLVFMDIAMAGMNGLETTWRLKSQHPQIHVVILSSYSNVEYVEQALQLGASGYLLKDASCNELQTAIEEVMQGETYLTPAVADLSLKGSYRSGSTFNDYEELSSRQRETLKLLAEGKSTKEIARILGIGVKTVETHRAHLMKKLEIHDLAGLVRYALRLGIVGIEQ